MILDDEVTTPTEEMDSEESASEEGSTEEVGSEAAAETSEEAAA